MTIWEHPAVWLNVQYQCFYNFTNQNVLVCGTGLLQNKQPLCKQPKPHFTYKTIYMSISDAFSSLRSITSSQLTKQLTLYAFSKRLVSQMGILLIF